MQENLTQCEVEWLRCLTVSRNLTPILPENVLYKLENALLVECSAGKTVVTENGLALLQQR